MQYGMGLYTGQVAPDEQHGFHEEYGRILEQARLAEQSGIDSIWLSEHHGSSDGYLPSLLPIAAAVLATTTRLKVGTAVMLAPFHDPLRLAEDVAVLDQLSGGRFILGLGTGWRSSEFRAFGLDPARRVATLEETVAVLKTAWQGARFSFDGNIHRIDDAVVRPGPFTPGGPPIWLGGTGPRALRRAGRLGTGYFGVGMPFDDAMRSYDAVLDQVEDSVRDRFAFGQLRSGFICDDPQKGWELAGPGMTYTLKVHADWAAEEAGGSGDSHAVPAEEIVRSYNLIGTADTVTRELRRYEERFAGRSDCHLALRLYHPYTPYDAVLGAIEEYGRTVIPALRR